MRMVLLVLAFLLVAVPFAAAAAAPEAGEKAPLRIIPKEAIASTIHAARSSAPAESAGERAPFLFSADDGLDVDFAPHPESRRGSPSSCDGDKTLCYDASNGHIVYKPIRNFMPNIPGFQRENISVNRHRILFKYSF